MEQPNLGNLRSTPFERLVSDALGELERLGYSRRSRMPSFLRFLTMRGILQKDLSAALPRVRVPRDLEMKRDALEKIADPSPVHTIPSWHQNKDLLYWLRSL